VAKPDQTDDGAAKTDGMDHDRERAVTRAMTDEPRDTSSPATPDDGAPTEGGASAGPVSHGGGRIGALPRRFALAVTFLTAMRLPTSGAAAPADLWASMALYPVVGLLLGLSGWGVYAVLLYRLTPLVAAAIVVVGLELATRALHLDGLMDTADGCLSGAPRERALEIMKDSRVGAMGVFAAIAVIVVKVSALAALARPGAALGLVGGLTVARLLPALDVRFFAYARREGTGAAFAGAGTTNGPVVAAVVCAAAVALAAGAVARSGVAGPFLGLDVAAAVVAVTVGVQALVARRLGGLTGDVYGLGVELAETLALIGAGLVVR